MRRLTIAPVAAVLAVFALLFGGYFGAYYGMLKYKDYRAVASQPDASDLRIVSIPKYRVSGEWIEAIFSPAHALDRRLRAEFWNESRSGGLI